MSEARVGVLIERRLGTDQRLVPGSADTEVAHRERDMVERGEGHRDSSLFHITTMC
jgi:hypothetical protein